MWFRTIVTVSGASVQRRRPGDGHRGTLLLLRHLVSEWLPEPRQELVMGFLYLLQKERERQSQNICSSLRHLGLQ